MRQWERATAVVASELLADLRLRVRREKLIDEVLELHGFRLSSQRNNP